MGECASGICSAGQLADELGVSPQAISNIVHQTPSLRDATEIVGGKRVIHRRLIPQIRAALAAREQKKMSAKHPLSTWTGAAVDDEFDGRHLALAMQFMRQNVGCSFEQAAEFARANYGREPGSNEPLTLHEAGAVMKHLNDHPGHSLQDAIFFARQASSDTEYGIQRQGRNPDPQHKLDKDGLPESVVYTSYKTPMTSEQREQHAKESASKQERLRRAWEKLKEASTELSAVDPEKASRMMKFLDIPGSDWQGALDALKDDDTMTKEEMDKALDLIKNKPRMPWNEAYFAVKGKYPR
jgi:hypothetical protein